MSERLRWALQALVGMAIGIAAFVVWAQGAADELTTTPVIGWSWLGLALVLMVVSLGLQVARTAVLFPALGLRGVVGPVLAGHGVNSLLSVAGDAVEAGWLATRSERGLAGSLGVLVARAAGTAGGAVFRWAIGVGTLVAVGGMVAIAAAGSMVWSIARRRGLVPVGVGTIVVQVILSCGQGLIEVLALLCVGRAVGAIPGLRDAVVAQATVELATYLPIPASGAGVHHLGLAWGLGESGAGWVVLVHHGLTLAIGLSVLGWAVGTHGLEALSRATRVRDGEGS